MPRAWIGWKQAGFEAPAWSSETAVLALAGSLFGQPMNRPLSWLPDLGGFPLPAWRDPLKGEEFSDGRDAQEVRSGLQGGRGAAGPGDRQADRAGGPGSGDQRAHPRELGERGPAPPRGRERR